MVSISSSAQALGMAVLRIWSHNRALCQVAKRAEDHIIAAPNASHSNMKPGSSHVTYLQIMSRSMQSIPPDKAPWISVFVDLLDLYVYTQQGRQPRPSEIS